MAKRIDADELLFFLNAPAGARGLLARWLNDSPRFLVFADQYRDKIRKKLRDAADAEGVRDVLSELETGHALLREPRFAVAYEASAKGQMRAPDFSVTWRTHTLYHVEAARLRSAALVGERLHELIGGKLGQMQPNAMNVLVIATATPLPSQAELDLSLKQLQARAERADPLMLARYHFEKRADFFKFFTRLSVLVLRHGEDIGSLFPPLLWFNKQARQPLPDEITRALRGAFTGG